jgi:hypothetical protein
MRKCMWEEVKEEFRLRKWVTPKMQKLNRKTKIEKRDQKYIGF